MRWRLKQALETLRRGLDARVTGGRRRWMAALGAPTAAGAATAKVAVAALLLVLAGGGALSTLATPTSGPPTPSGAAPQTATSATVDDAQQAYLDGRYEDAIRMADESKDQDPSRAWKIIGASSCFLQDPTGAAEAWQALDPNGRKFIEYVCQRNDVVLPDGAEVL